MLKHEIPYQIDSSKIFSRIAHRPWAVFLDSGQPESQFGHYDIMVADPFIRLVTNGQQTEIFDSKGRQVSTDDPFDLLKSALAAYHLNKTDLPFEGGAIGYFAYDLARRVEVLPNQSLDAERMPEMMVGIYDWAVIVDHRLAKAWLVSHAFDEVTASSWPELCALFDTPLLSEGESTFEVTSALSSNMDYNAYAQAFDQVKQYIYEGDCYQVNLAQRFSAQARGNAWLAYQALRNISPAPFMAYMHFSGIQPLHVLSASPERFLQVMDGHVETRPIKGTRPRSIDPVQDKLNAESLQQSLKDRAENLMIVDLLRNDIGKACETGSVRADHLFTLESFANVHHLVSTVTGKLAQGMHALDLLRACFPGGSITGAPKLRAMEIIEELEPNRRGLYCGAIGYIGFDGDMDTNIAIRTLVMAQGKAFCWACGGIVADSEVNAEYEETFHKVNKILPLLGKITA